MIGTTEYVPTDKRIIITSCYYSQNGDRHVNQVSISYPYANGGSETIVVPAVLEYQELEKWPYGQFSAKPDVEALKDVIKELMKKYPDLKVQFSFSYPREYVF